MRDYVSAEQRQNQSWDSIGIHTLRLGHDRSQFLLDSRPFHSHIGRPQLRRRRCNAAFSFGSSSSGSVHELANTRSAAVGCFVWPSQEFQGAVGTDYRSCTVEYPAFFRAEIQRFIPGVCKAR